ncbi:MAG TPA: cytochrome D1 domain-containing protein, partial [Myxococcota bacterium]|nr:cytochrome D1 domain-containing protein [Myxococcota bacterium]
MHRLQRAFAAALALAPVAAGASDNAARATGSEQARAARSEIEAVYASQCATCHGARRYGGYAPPLLAETLAQKTDDALVAAILEGLPATQMPGFSTRLRADEARVLVSWFREPVGEIRWSLSDIAASRVAEPPQRAALASDVDRGELIFVVERGRGAVSVLDGRSLLELDRFEVGNVHGGIKFDRELQRALVATRDGTLVDYDLVRGAVRARAKVGVNTRNIAISGDGRFVAAANQLPQELVVLDGELRPLASFPLPGQPSAVYRVPDDRRFLVALRDVPELYSLRYPELELERVALPEAFEDFVFVPGANRLVASSRAGSRLVLYDFERDAVVATLACEGLPHLFSASFFERDGALLAAFNHVGVPRLSIVDVGRFALLAELPLLGSGYFTRTHPGTPYLWIDSNSEAIQLVDKRSLELVERALIPEPGKK